MTKFKTIITAAIAALALTTASLAIPGQAFAGGHGQADMAATAITESAMVILATAFSAMVITTIGLSSPTTAAGNGAPTAR